MANVGALLLLLLTIALKICTIAGILVEGKVEPVQYVSFPPSTYNEGSFNVGHTIGNCMLRTERIDRDDENVVICPNGELLLDGITQANLEDNVIGSDIRTFYTWRHKSIPSDKAFIILQFPNNVITPTKVAVYCLRLQNLRVREPKKIRLYYSTRESIFPDRHEIQGAFAENDFVVTGSGRTSENDEYEYRRYDLIISENSRVSLNYLCIEFEFNDWIFISEVEVYHLYEQLPNSTSMQVPTPSITTSPSANPLSTKVSATTTSASRSSSVEIMASSSLHMTTMPFMSTASTLSTAQLASSTPRPTTNTFQPPTFVFPTVNPFVLNFQMVQLNVTINCTVTWDGDLSQLTTTWSYNGTIIKNSQRYVITEAGLLIRQITPQDVGTYECTVKHPSGWNASHQYFISVKDGDLVQQPSEASSKDLPLPIIIGMAAGTLLMLCLALTISVIIIIIMCRRKNKQRKSFLHAYVNENPPKQRKCFIDSRYESMNMTCSRTAENSIKEVPPTVPRFPKKFKYSKRIPPPKIPKLQGDYAFLGIYKATTSVLVPDQTSETYFDIYDDTVSTAVKPIPQLPQDYCEAFDYNRHEEDPYNHISMCVSIYNNPKPLAQAEGPEFVEWSNVKVVAKIGEGQFGDVYLAETSGVNDAEQGTKSLAAIKTLKGDYSLYLKKQFEKEIKFMSRLDNANVVKLLGICNKGTPFIMMEYMNNGNLHMFLRKHYLAEIGQDTAEAVIPIDSNVILQYVALQIANGMRYLASYGFIHRDLAARNCLVGEDYIVKIADFGMTQDLYNESYILMQGKAIVPIRWMAPECFFGKFSAKTDVWSYGVTLWEIFTLCRNQPYHEMTDEQFIINVQKECNRTLLKQPPFIPDEFFRVMTECWLYDSKKRPDFESVYNQLFDFYIQYHQQ